MNRKRLDDLARDNQAGALVEEAFHILAAVYPIFANVLWQYAVEGRTIGELKEILQRSCRRIRGYLNGYTDSGTYIWGAWDWLGTILDLLVEARSCKEGDELDRAFAFATRANPWGDPFPATMLDLLIQAQDTEALCCVLARLGKSRAERRYAILMDTLLDRYDRQDLESFLAVLCPDGGGDRDRLPEDEGQPA